MISKRGAYLGMGIGVLCLIIGAIMLESNFVSRQLAYEKEKGARKKACADVQQSGSTTVVTQDQKDKYKASLEGIRAMYEKENGVKKYFKKQINEMDLAMGILIGPAIFLAFAIFSLIGWWCYILCCVCESICPPCKKCCKCCRQDKPYTKMELGWPIVGAFVFLIWICVNCIVGLASSGDLHASYKTVNCAVISVFDSLVFGEKSLGWKGIEGLSIEMTEFSGQLGSFLATTSSTFGQGTWVSTSNTKLNADIALLEKPAYDGQTTWKYTKIVKTGGARELSSYFSGPFVASAAVLKGVVTGAIKAIKESVESLEAQGNSIKSQTGFQTAINSGVTSLNSIIKQIADFITTTDASTSQGDAIFAILTVALNAVYGAFLGISILCAIVIVLIIFFKFYKLRVVLHSFWCLFSIIMILTFILSAVFTIISLAGFDFCEMLDTMLNDNKEFASYQSLISVEISNKIITCKASLGGKGDILREFGIEEQLKDIDRLKENITDFQKQAGSSSPNYQATIAMIQQVNQLIADIDVVAQTNVIATGSTTADHPDLNTALTALQVAAAACSASQADLYKKAKSECITPVITDTWDDVSQIRCFWIGGIPSNDSKTVISTTQTRYASCSATPKADIYAKLALIIDWRTEKYSLCTDKTSSSVLLRADLKEFIAKLDAYTVGINNYLATAIVVLDKVTDRTNGILGNLNCLFLGNSLDNLFNATCVSFITNFWKLSTMITVLSFGMFFTSFFLFCLSMRYSRQGDLEKKDKLSKITNN